MACGDQAVSDIELPISSVRGYVQLSRSVTSCFCLMEGL